jgi:hypothetical protein
MHLVMLLPTYGPGVVTASDRNEYQESSCGSKGRPAHKADNLTAICMLSRKMREHRRLTIVWTSTACYKNSFTYLICLHIIVINVQL